MVDLALYWDNETGQGADINVCCNDIELTTNLAGDLRNATYIALFCDALAPVDAEIPDSTADRRGYWADAFSTDPTTGSLLWLLSREKKTPENLRKAKQYASDALQQLVTEGVVLSVQVETDYGDDGELQIEVTLQLKNGESLVIETNCPCNEIQQPVPLALIVAQQPSAVIASGEQFPQQPWIQVIDQYGNPFAALGVAVTVAIASGLGDLRGTTTATTDSSGIAIFDDLSIIGLVGERTLIATAASLARTVTTAISVVAGDPAGVAMYVGDDQVATAGTAVAIAPSVIVTDIAGNGVSGAQVTWAVSSGGGSVVDPAITTTDASGIATCAGWKLGAAGLNTLQAIDSGVAGSPVTFTATSVMGTATTMSLNAGNAQSATVNTQVSTNPSVIIRDAHGYGVSGVTVTWAVTAGGGSIVGANTSVSDSNGIATCAGWKVGTDITQTNAMTATHSGLSGSPVIFIASAVAGAAASIYPGPGGSGGTVGSVVSESSIATVIDNYGNSVSGVAVTISVTAGGGGISLSSSGPFISSLSTTTIGTGCPPRFYWKLGTVAGSQNNALSVSCGSITGSPALITVDATAGAAISIVKLSGDAQSATHGTAVATPPSVQLRDQYGNPSKIGVTGTVTFAVASGGGSITGAAASISSIGVATVGSWTLGATGGSNTLTATKSGLTGSPLTFTATGT